MKVLIIFLLCVSYSFGQSGTWIQIDSMNGIGKSVTTSFVLENVGYVVGGLTDFNFTRKMYSYSPIQDDWDSETSWGGELGSGQNRGSAVSFSIGNKAYCCLGQGETQTYYQDVWEYDPITKVWTQLADFAGSARNAAVGFSIGDFGYVGLGQDENGLRKDFYKFDPSTNSWLQIADFGGTARKYAVAQAMGLQAYVGTGDDGVLRNDFWEFNSVSQVWTPKTNLPSDTRAGAVCWASFPSFYIATGENAAGILKKDVWEYNYFSQTWTQRNDFAGPARKHAVAFAIDGVAYLGSGYIQTGFTDDFYKFQIPLEINETTTENLLLYPNPIQNEAKIQLSESLSKIEIYKTSGELALEVNEVSSSVDLRNLSSGNYLLKGINSEGKFFLGKFSKL